MFDTELLKMILSGRCFAFIGAGPSADLGYPSWQNLAKRVYAAVQEKGIASDSHSYEKFLEEKKYPELLKQAEIDLGSRAALIAIVKEQLRPADYRKGPNLYSYLTRWPFACYLTTNYDDEIQRALDNHGIAISVKQNQVGDFFPIQDGVKGYLWKIHSDLDHPDLTILTSDDYHSIYASDTGAGFRAKLRQVFEMFPILIIGYSISDPHISYILQTATQTANPEHPIYLVAADLSEGDIREYREHFNVRVIPYDNPDGSHSGLRRILQQIDKFVPARKPEHVVTRHPESEIEAATALLIARRLQNFSSAQSDELVSPLILVALNYSNQSGLTLEQLLKLPMLSPIAKNESFRNATIEAVKNLKSSGEVEEESGKFFLTDTAKEKVAGLSGIRLSMREEALARFNSDMYAEYPALTSRDAEAAAELILSVFVNVFRTRGLTIASGVFAGQSVGSEDLPEIFAWISDAAGRFDKEEVQYAFVEASRKFLVSPSDAQRDYVAALSQGYFLYHLAGLDPHLTILKKTVLTDAAWIIDSHVLIPLVALGCYYHEYAKDLLGRLTKAGAKIYTTSSLLKETKMHLEWAVNFIRSHHGDLNALLSVANIEPPFKQNLFVDGFIRSAADGNVKDFDEYLYHAFGKGDVDELFDKNIIDMGFEILQPQPTAEMDELIDSITSTRQRKGTYRGDLQVLAEAEVLSLIRELKAASDPSKQGAEQFAYFISQSRVLDQSFPEEGVVTWSPEALYRFVISLLGEGVSSDLLQQCMLNEYYYAGVNFIDEERYVRFFGPVIRQARLKYEEEKTRYLEEAATNDDEARLDQQFEQISDLQKPLFAVQMVWKVADKAVARAEILAKQTKDLQDQVKRLEDEKAAGWKKKEAVRQQQDAARQRHLLDPKHQRKRARQAKKRQRKKGR